MNIKLTEKTPASIHRPLPTWDEVVSANAAIVTDGHDQRIAVHVTSCGCLALALQDWRRDPLQLLYLSNAEAVDLARALLNAQAKVLDFDEIAAVDGDAL